MTSVPRHTGSGKDRIMAKMLQSWIGRAALAVGAVAVAAIAATALGSGEADAQAAGQVKSLSVGGGHVCAITEAGAVLCWGRNDLGQADAPVRRGFGQVLLGEDFSCGTATTGFFTNSIGSGYHMACWGSRESNRFQLHGSDTLWNPEGIGIEHAWSHGSNTYGQLSTSDLGGNWEDTVIGGWHTCRIATYDGSLGCVGRNDSGQTDTPHGRYVSVGAGRTHTCAVTDENRLRCWGNDILGQSSPPGGSDYLEVSSNAFANFNCALTDEKKVRCWGDNRYGQLNVPVAIAAPPPLQFTQPIEPIITRKNQPIGPFVFPPASGGTGRLSYNIAYTGDSGRKKGTPTGLVFDETARRLSGRPFDGPGSITLHYSVSDTSGRSEEVDITLIVIGPVPAGYAPAITWPELGTLDRGLIRCGVWSDESRTFSGGAYDTYAFRLAAPAQVTIALESAEADTYLLLEGDQQWRDDDGGQGTNSRITAGLPPARYWLHVYTADGGGEGAYTLRISSPDFPAGNADASRSCPSGSDGEGTSTTGEGNLDPASAGRITARRLEDGRIEFAWQPEGGERVLPRSRYLPSSPPRGRWLNSSEIVVDGASVGRINVRVGADDGRIEFAFTPTGGERILPPSRYFPADANIGSWLRSTLIEPGG